jgi:aspartyl-tRNA(Asn)/glutamyl-tRNA(Gln) amidotransferase subunit A
MPSSNTDPSFLPAHRLAVEIEARRLSPVDIVEALLSRIEAQNPKLHAFIDVYAADARLAAEAADRAIRSGHAVGPLHGVPIALKDLIDLEGRITTGGSMVWRERRSPVTATLARRLIAAGMIVLGGCFRHGAVGDRHRYRRVGAAAGVVVRPLRAQDDDRPGQHLWHPAARPLA